MGVALVYFRKRNRRGNEVEFVLPHLDNLDYADTPRTVELDFSNDSFSHFRDDELSIDSTRGPIDASIDNEEIHQPESKGQNRFYPKSNLRTTCRRRYATIAIFGLLLFGLTYLYVVHGLQRIYLGFYDLKEGGKSTELMLGELLNILLDAHNSIRTVDNHTTSFLLNMHLVCPNLNLTTFIGKDVNEAVSMIGATASASVIQLSNIAGGVESARSDVSGVLDFIRSYEWLIWLCTSLVFVMLILAYFTAAKSTGMSIGSAEYPLKSMYLPMYVLLVTSITGFAAVFSIFAVIGSDFCSDGIEGLLAADDETEMNRLIVNSIEYYTEGCKTENPMQLLYSASSFMQKVVNALAALNDYLGTESNTSLLRSKCGISTARIDTNRFIHMQIQTSINIETEMRRILSLLQRTMSLVECRKINSVYSRINDDAICGNFVRGAIGAWLTLTFLAMIALLILGISVQQPDHCVHLSTKKRKSVKGETK
mmetsp:Transcript_10713/g.15935  ORF Transcript_10713/g.15935 Transcript_10713/m.15935 type:complete len:482 (-) Transcript_10713:58-1503(-)